MIVLKNILNSLNIVYQQGNVDIGISDIVFDSREVSKNSLFVAVSGTQSDGHAFVKKAIDNGAVAIVCQKLPEELNIDIAYVQVKNSAQALGKLASAYYSHPSKKLKLIGITGTNGKTTTATLLYQLFLQMGYKVGLLSTICNYVHTNKIKATHTTPNPVELNSLLADMVDAGCDFCFMEVSSHAICQSRIAGLEFAGGVFTNITQDHLDYHKTFAEYIKAKKMFFDQLPKTAFALVNTDDKNSQIMLQNTKAKKLGFASRSIADYQVRIVEARTDGMLLSINNLELWTQLIGNFNAYNLLAVYAVAVELKQDANEVAQVLSKLKNVEGRFQTITSESGKIAIIDYAHTPDAVENVLKTIEQITQGNTKIITVIGAGGDRDKSKRPIMAAIAAKMSNHVILTSDNPRNEKPEDIINDMKKGVLPPYNAKLLVIENRKEAIRTACTLAQKGDVVLVAGKGHENYQEINGVKHHFDDTEIVNEIFENN